MLRVACVLRSIEVLPLIPLTSEHVTRKLSERRKMPPQAMQSLKWMFPAWPREMWKRTLKRKLKVLDIAANKASGFEHVSNNVSYRHMLAGALNPLGVCCVCFVSCCVAATRLHCQHGMHITLIIAWLPIAMPWNSTCCRCQLAHLPLRMRVGVHGGCLNLLVSFGPSWNTDRGVWCMCKQFR